MRSVTSDICKKIVVFAFTTKFFTFCGLYYFEIWWISNLEDHQWQPWKTIAHITGFSTYFDTDPRWHYTASGKLSVPPTDYYRVTMAALEPDCWRGIRRNVINQYLPSRNLWNVLVFFKKGRVGCKKDVKNVLINKKERKKKMINTEISVCQRCPFLIF